MQHKISCSPLSLDRLLYLEIMEDRRSLLLFTDIYVEGELYPAVIDRYFKYIQTTNRPSTISSNYSGLD